MVLTSIPGQKYIYIFEPPLKSFWLRHFIDRAPTKGTRVFGLEPMTNAITMEHVFAQGQLL